ncbi:MAG: hypothetical protein ACOC3V_05520 [bacterium]
MILIEKITMTELNINIPEDHKEKLNFIKEQITKIYIQLNNYERLEEYNPKELAVLSEKTMYYLDKVGEMSCVLFEQRDKLKKQYFIKYLHSPELGKKLFLDYNAKIHAPYDKLKDKCWKIFEIIDKKIIKNKLSKK